MHLIQQRTFLAPCGIDGINQVHSWLRVDYKHDNCLIKYKICEVVF